MNIDDLSSAIKNTSSDPVVQRLAALLSEWKNDDSDVARLESLVEHYIGNAWIAGDEVHREVYRLWAVFRHEAVRGIGGMTMNERLFHFGLFSRFDNARTEDERRLIYAKLLAHP